MNVGLTGSTRDYRPTNSNGSLAGHYVTAISMNQAYISQEEGQLTWKVTEGVGSKED
jgi:hypothetical protein